MAQYLVAIHHPDNYDPSKEDEAMIRDIDVLNLRRQPKGEVVITDGPYLETKEHVGGFWILEAADMDEALAWGRKAVIACRASVEVRPFLVPA